MKVVAEWRRMSVINLVVFLAPLLPVDIYFQLF